MNVEKRGPEMTDRETGLIDTVLSDIDEQAKKFDGDYFYLLYKESKAFKEKNGNLKSAWREGDPFRDFVGSIAEIDLPDADPQEVARKWLGKYRSFMKMAELHGFHDISSGSDQKGDERSVIACLTGSMSCVIYGGSLDEEAPGTFCFYRKFITSSNSPSISYDEGARVYSENDRKNYPKAGDRLYLKDSEGKEGLRTSPVVAVFRFDSSDDPYKKAYEFLRSTNLINNKIIYPQLF